MCLEGPGREGKKKQQFLFKEWERSAPLKREAPLSAGMHTQYCFIFLFLSFLLSQKRQISPQLNGEMKAWILQAITHSSLHKPLCLNFNKKVKCNPGHPYPLWKTTSEHSPWNLNIYCKIQPQKAASFSANGCFIFGSSRMPRFVELVAVRCLLLFQQKRVSLARAKPKSNEN